MKKKRIFVSKTDRESYSGNPYCYRTEKEAAASFFLSMQRNSFRVTTPPVEIFAGGGVGEGCLFKRLPPPHFYIPTGTVPAHDAAPLRKIQREAADVFKPRVPHESRKLLSCIGLPVRRSDKHVEIEQRRMLRSAAVVVEDEFLNEQKTARNERLRGLPHDVGGLVKARAVQDLGEPRHVESAGRSSVVKSPPAKEIRSAMPESAMTRSAKGRVVGRSKTVALKPGLRRQKWMA